MQPEVYMPTRQELLTIIEEIMGYLPESSDGGSNQYNPHGPPHKPPHRPPPRPHRPNGHRDLSSDRSKGLLSSIESLLDKPEKSDESHNHYNPYNPDHGHHTHHGHHGHHEHKPHDDFSFKRYFDDHVLPFLEELAAPFEKTRELQRSQTSEQFEGSHYCKPACVSHIDANVSIN
jgi:hypothetical protein